MTSPARVPPHVPTLTEVVPWSDSVTPTHWKAPDAIPPDLAREVEARVMHQILQILPGLVTQAVEQTIQNAASKKTDD
jgi:hypothetical protein